MLIYIRKVSLKNTWKTAKPGHPLLDGRNTGNLSDSRWIEKLIPA